MFTSTRLTVLGTSVAAEVILIKCGVTLYDILAFFGPKLAFLMVLSVFLVENRPTIYPL